MVTKLPRHKKRGIFERLVRRVYTKKCKHYRQDFILNHMSIFKISFFFIFCYVIIEINVKIVIICDSNHCPNIFYVLFLVIMSKLKKGMNLRYTLKIVNYFD